jgi:putative acetyltransferase
MLLICSEQPEDITAIRQVNERAFGRSDEADLVDAVRARGKAVLSLVGVEGDQIIGHIFFSPVTIESDNGIVPAIGLAPMAVVPERQRCRIGSQLVRAGLAGCRNAGYHYVVVLGHQTYYPRFGFVPASQYGITSEYTVPDEAFTVLAWPGGILSQRGGLARYEPEFRDV